MSTDIDSRKAKALALFWCLIQERGSDPFQTLAELLGSTEVPMNEAGVLALLTPGVPPRNRLRAVENVKRTDEHDNVP